MANWQGALQGGLGGAGSGAAIGSMIAPGIGTAIGAGAGGLAGLLSGLFGGGEKGGVKQAQRFNPVQQNALNLLLTQGAQGLQNPYSGFDDIANYVNKNYKENILPSLAERFTSMGNGALSSPVYGSQLGQSNSGLTEALAALRAQYGQQNQQNALSLLSLGLSPSFENFYQEETPGFGQRFLGLSAQAAPQLYQNFLLNRALQNR